MNEIMNLIEITGNILKITSYNSSTGTISTPIGNVRNPKPTVSTYNIGDLYTRVKDSNVKNAINLTIRTTEIVLIETNFVVSKVTLDTLDTNSTSYSADMDAYHASITTTIMA